MGGISFPPPQEDRLKRGKVDRDYGDSVRSQVKEGRRQSTPKAKEVAAKERCGAGRMISQHQERKRPIAESLSPSWTSAGRGAKRSFWADAVLDERLAPHLKNAVGLGFRVRTRVVGPEQDLVDQFLSTQEFHLPPGRQLTVIPHPAVETGFPDLVAVVWRPSTTRNWKRERLALLPQDIQLLHLLSSAGWADRSFLSTLFPRGFRQSIDRLVAADLLIVGATKCRSRSLKHTFAVEQIIAVEAKVTWWRRAVEQARNNLWFSSESHVLLPEKRSIGALVAEIETLGIGVLGQLTADTNLHKEPEIHLHKEPEIQRVPASYGSWLFNEWVWRIAVHQEQV